jgi:hypothetical protein
MTFDRRRPQILFARGLRTFVARRAEYLLFFFEPETLIREAGCVRR